MTGSAQRAAWREFARGRLRPMLEGIGWQPAIGEAEPVGLLRESLIETLGRLDDPVVVDRARDRFMRAERDPAAMPAAIYDAVLTVVATHADGATWNEIRRRARAAQQPMEKQRLYMALGRAYNPALSARALDLALTDEPPAAYASNMMQWVSIDHPEQAYDFAIRHEPEVLKRVDAASRWAFIPSLAENSFDRSTATRVRAYAEASIPADARIGAEKAIASIDERASVRDRQLPALEAWLRSRRHDAR
jgi:aminopeptidase N